MKKEIDCLLIGHNNLTIAENISRAKKFIGTDSNYYKELDIHFIKYKNRPYTITELYNKFIKSESNLDLGITDRLSLAIAYLGTSLNRNGFSFDYVNSFQDEKDELIYKLQNHKIKTVAIVTTFYFMIWQAQEVISLIRKYNKDVKIILGGPYIVSIVLGLKPNILQRVFKMLDADYYIHSIGGEDILVSLLKAIKNNASIKKIANIFYKREKDGLYVETSSLPDKYTVKEDMIDWKLFKSSVSSFCGIRTSISCPFNCAFCSYPIRGGKYQTMDVDAIEYDLRKMVDSGGVDCVGFLDDTFNVPQDRFKDILRMIIRNRFTFKWYSNFRCQFADRETVELMKESGCVSVFLGIESGSPEILKNMNKHAKVEEYKRGIRLLKEYGITTSASFILGFPGETYETALETKRFIEETEVDFYVLRLWFGDATFPIWQRREEFGLSGVFYDWSHNTMNAVEANDLLKKFFCSIDKSVFCSIHLSNSGLFGLLQHGFSANKMKGFLMAFNDVLKKRLGSSEDLNLDKEIESMIVSMGGKLPRKPSKIMDFILSVIAPLLKTCRGRLFDRAIQFFKFRSPD